MNVIVCVILHMSVITQSGWFALMRAASDGQTETVVELVKAGADLNLQSNVCHNILHVMLYGVILCIIHVYGRYMYMQL